MNALPENDRIRVETATIVDLDELVTLLIDLMAIQGDFTPDRDAHEEGIRLILEQPNRGRIFVLRNDERIIGMVNLLFTISTALGGFVAVMEDVVVHPDHRGQGYGSMLLNEILEFSEKRAFKRVTLLTDKISEESQKFFKKNGFAYSGMIPMRRLLDKG